MNDASTLPRPPDRDEQQFWDLITADRDLLRAEFDAIIGAAWPAPLTLGEGGPRPGNAPGPPVAPRSDGRRAHPAVHRRQRSPPPATPPVRNHRAPGPARGAEHHPR
jgi:hypothetical protein